MEAALFDEVSFSAQQQRRQINKYSYQYNFGTASKSPETQVSVLQEYIHIDLELSNPLRVPIQFQSVQLLCSHEVPASYSSPYDTPPEGDPFILVSSDAIVVQPVDFLLGARETKKLRFSVVPLKEGLLTIRGLGFYLANTI